MSNLLKKIYLGDLSKYTDLENIEENSLYMTENSVTKVKSIYKGNKKVSGDFIIINGVRPDEPEEGIIYYISEFENVDDKKYPFTGFYINGEWVSLCRDITDELDKKQNLLTEGFGIEIDDNNVIKTTIDLSLIKIVSSLPETDIDDTKIYLLLDSKGIETNKYKEYIHHENGWELLGEYNGEIDLTNYLKKDDAEKTYMKLSNGGATISMSNNGSMNNFGDNGQAFNAVRDCGTKSLTGYAINASAFGVKMDGTTGFSHKKYDSFNGKTGAYTGAKNTAVLTFSGATGLRYGKNTGGQSDVSEEMYRYVGVIDSPDERQQVYSKKQVDDLLKTLTDKISALETRVQELENK